MTARPSRRLEVVAVAVVALAVAGYAGWYYARPETPEAAYVRTSRLWNAGDFGAVWDRLDAASHEELDRAYPLLARQEAEKLTDPAAAHDLINLRGRDLFVAVSASGGFNSSGWPTAAAPDPGKYLTFTLNPDGGDLTVTQLAVSDLRSSTGPATGSVRSSADNFAADLGTFAIGTAASTSTIPVTGVADVTTPIEFRIYAYSAGASGGRSG